MPEPFTIEQQRAFFDEVWKNQEPDSGMSYATCPNDGYRMKANILKEENPRADIHVYCPKCGDMTIDSESDPRADIFRDWTDDEKQGMVDRHFRGQNVSCPVDGTAIRPAPLGDNVLLHCHRCGNDHYGSIHHRIGRYPLLTDTGADLPPDWVSHYLPASVAMPVGQHTVSWPKAESEDSLKWDLFISHAHEDKQDVAEPLANRLRELGLEVWYDGFTLKLGDSLRRSIDQGLARSTYGLVILSPYFFKKHWPQKELDGLAALETGENKKILPVWHNVGQKDVAEFSPTLADRLGVPTGSGLDNVVAQIMAVVRPDGMTYQASADPNSIFPPEAVDILRGAASSKTGTFYAGSDLDGYSVQAGGFVFQEKESNPRMAVRHKGFIRKLEEAGLISKRNEDLYEITEAGFEFVDGLEKPTV